jgi:Flp pilus assembly protein TadG
MSKKFEITYGFRQRKQKGSISVVVLIIAFFGVLPLALLGFEMSRFFLIQSELQHVLDAAALSGTAALASSPSGLTVTQQQQLAMQTAINNFEQNSVLETNFNSGNTTGNLNTSPNNANPPLHNAIINITLFDQNNNPQATGSATATVMRIAAAYTDQPIFLRNQNSLFASIQGLYTARAFSTGGLPQLDLVLCFDTSGSMDDETVVSFVRREWSGTTRAVHYVMLAEPILTGAVAPLNTASIYNTTYPPETGTSLNATWPQNLSFASFPNTASGATYSHPYVFTDAPNADVANPLNGLRALTSAPAGSVSPEQGRPPGNFLASNPSNQLMPNGSNPDATPLAFTDMVYVPTGYSVQAAVEASRGNLNGTSILSTSMGGTATSNTVSPELTAAGGFNITPTAYTDYWTLVNTNAQPINFAKQASVQFFNLMNTSSNAHFELETFSTAAGSVALGGPNGVYTDPDNTSNFKTDAAYPAGGVGSFPLPLIQLNLTNPQLTECINAVQGTGGITSPGLIAEGKTDIGDALQQAFNDLTNTSIARPTAKKAIILFTDGIPNMPTATATTLPNSVAAQCKAKGIPIYTIGLSTNLQVVFDEGQFLGDGTNGGNGIAFLSGNNATYSPVSSSAALNSAFQSIARGLVVLQQ